MILEEKQPRMRQVPRRGSALIYITIVITVIVAFCSLAVDLGRVQVAKTELRRAVDAAVRYGASGLSSGATTATQYAKDAAQENRVDGNALVLNTSDISFVYWNSQPRTYTTLPNATGANGLRISARYTVPLLFAKVIGKSSCDVTAEAIAVSAPIRGIVGLNGITIKNATLIAGYNSSVDPNPNAGTATAGALVGSNGAIVGGAANVLSGQLYLGPSAPAPVGVTVIGSTTILPAPIDVPQLPAWAPGSNPAGIGSNYTNNSSTPLPAGTYWFTKLNVRALLTFSGPATVYINGDVDLQNSIAGAGNIPANLRIYQYGSHTFGDSGTNNISITADLLGPGSDFVLKNQIDFRGRMLFNTITLKNTGAMFYDTSLGSSSTGQMVMTVK